MAKEYPSYKARGFCYTYNMKALHNLVVIKIEDKSTEKTASGLVIPKDKWGEKQNVATIVTEHVIIDGEEELTKDDRVLINPYAVLDTPEKDIKLIAFQDILAVL